MNSKLHRNGGPAIEKVNGDKSWYEHGECHRAGGLPAVEHANGDKLWYERDKRHRVDGPAGEFADGRREWWIKGKLHRVDGPAVEYADGDKTWWVDGRQITEAESKEITSGLRHEAARRAAEKEIMTNPDYRDPFGSGR